MTKNTERRDMIIKTREQMLRFKLIKKKPRRNALGPYAQRFQQTSNVGISLSAIIPIFNASQNLNEISTDKQKKEMEQIQEEVLNLDEYNNSTSENDTKYNLEKEIFIGNMINRLYGYTDKVEPSVTPYISQISGNLIKLTPDDVFSVLNK